MLKKLAFFIFSLGVAVSYASAMDPEECRELCQSQYEQCESAGYPSPAACYKYYARCVARCNV